MVHNDGGEHAFECKTEKTVIKHGLPSATPPCMTSAFSGSPIEGDQIRSGYITPAFLGADCLVRGGKNRHGWGMVKKRCQVH